MSKKTNSRYCPFKDGLMYKPGATFYDPILEKTLVCCSGIKTHTHSKGHCKTKCWKVEVKKLKVQVFSMFLKTLA